jgi:hypothetical protein
MCSVSHAKPVHVSNAKPVHVSNAKPVHVSNSKPALVSNSLRKLAISKTAQQPVKMLPMLNFTPIKATTTPSKNTPKKTPGLDSTFQKMNKLKQIDDKADQAMKARDEQLREKAERAKRFLLLFLIQF